MICEAHPVLFDRFLGLQAPMPRHLNDSKVCPAMQNTAVLCHVWLTAPAHPAVRVPRKTEYWFSDGGLDCLRSLCTRRHFIRRFHPVPGGQQNTRWSTTCLQDTPQFGKAVAEQETNWATHGWVGSLKVWRIPGPALPSFGHRCRARWCLFTCFRTPTDCGECWGWSYKTRLSVPVALLTLPKMRMAFFSGEKL
jgi:hypothetical protein